MTQDDDAQTYVPTGPHPYVCPACGRSGVLDIATGISTCAACEAQWRGPRVTFARPPTEGADMAAWAQAMVDEVLRGD